MDRKRLLPPPTEEAVEEEDGSESQVAKRWRGLLVQEILQQVDFSEVIAVLLRRLPVELEEVIRRVVREQLQLIANHTPLASRLLTNQDKEIKYCLHFQNTLAPELFTYNRIVAADSTELCIAIMDSNSGEVITSDPWSSVKVEIVVVEGDFGGDDKKVWTEEEFKYCVVSPRDGKGPLLIGKLAIKLTNGIGYLVSAKFTDNSSCTRSKKFRLAARLSPSEHIEERVLEGITEPFRVKDRRVKANQKHHPPLLTDEVWHLKHIMKNGTLHKRLEKNGIGNVAEFLQLFTTDPKRLRSFLGYGASKKGISDKVWDAIIAHAKECCEGDNLAGQHMGDLSASLQEIHMGGLPPIGSIPIPQPNPQAPPYPAYQTAHYDEPAVQGDFQDLCQFSYDEQGIDQLQQPVSLQTNGLHSIGIADEGLFGTRSGFSGMYGNMDDDDFNISAMLCCFSTVEVVRKYKKWFRLISILRFWISMSKRKACRETGVVQLNCPNIEPSSSFDAPGTETGGS